ncbi:Lipoteichoic acid synthase 1 [Convivina praedatoris]|uniref:Lipoteichoic acid synthase 1 n=2 Tax=Convivina praedatoris TaxID=2880963 RepID=A0ABM9D3K6_9LACO|nr:Lipoteichoic acid synthase 1 [Convivina sp. LMG 32447]CAH1857238.1 Lipoteichoic acid synthase 1 [Convivina sp. LMG 32447]CAH1857440.1 Lipoteichoic acid synthase 1 [Convivina sp. LMG 32447]
MFSMRNRVQDLWQQVLSPKNWNRQLNSRKGFFVWIVILMVLKTILAYGADFNWLHIASPVQFILIFFNPVGFTIIFLSLALFIRRKELYYGALLLLDGLLTTLLYINVTYFREFSDYMSINTMLGYKTVNQGTKVAGAVTLNWHDVFFWADIVVLIGLFVFKKIKFDNRRLPQFYAFKTFTFGWLLLALNFMVADIERPQLLTRQFDREYLVKYLGLGPFTICDAYNTYETSQVRKSARPDQLDEVKAYIKSHYAEVNPSFYGTAKGKNVIVIHLESFQQLSIDRQINGQEVTPFLNSLYHDQGTIAFDNFFHQVGQGKTSDAENMLETSTFGLPQGSLFSKLGNDQTFQAMPAILNQRADYSSAVFHGNTGTFWNRSNVYKRMGYQNWVSGEYFDVTGKKATSWGLKDKLLFRDSVPYLERLSQPFYAKYLTVTNHTPFDIDKQDQDPNFVTTNSGSKYVDNYFVANHYLDQSLKEFFDYLKKTGLYDNTMVVLYGDHYGISNTENHYLAPILGRTDGEWTDLDNANLQRTPLIIHIPGYKEGHIDHTYGGEIDVAPTIEHLLGISTKRYIQFGQDLLSTKRQQLVVFRNKDWISPDYASLSGSYWNVKTGQRITDPTTQEQETFNKLQDSAVKELAMSDDVNQKNLLRFYDPKGFKAIDDRNYDYSKSATVKRLKQQSEERKSNSLYAKNGDKTTLGDYVTDAPEVYDAKGDTTRVIPRGADDFSGSN